MSEKPQHVVASASETLADGSADPPRESPLDHRGLYESWIRGAVADVRLRRVRRTGQMAAASEPPDDGSNG